VRDGAVRGPLDPVVLALLDKIGLGAALVAVAVDALLDGKVEDAAAEDLALCLRKSDIRTATRHRSGARLKKPVRSMPAAKICWGMYILALRWWEGKEAVGAGEALRHLT
jgi:hypothetical protein